MLAVYIAVGVAVLLYLLFFLENRRFCSVCTVCEHTAIRQAFRVVQISDLHDARFGKEQSRLIQTIREAKPDYIVITGDLFNRRNHKASKHVFELIKGILDIAPVYFAEGNHECVMLEDGEHYLSQLSDLGVNVLRNAYANVPHCRIVGLKQFASTGEIKRLLSKNRCNIVLSHRPERIDICSDSGADVVLCGHAHGGQLRFGHHGMYAPQQGFFPKYTEGWHQQKNTKMYVSRGLGNTIPIPRVFDTPELNVIDFQPMQKEVSNVC